MIESEDVQDLGVGCIRNDAVQLFDVEKHKTGAANVFIYIRPLIMHSGGWELLRFQRNTTDGICLAVIVYTTRFGEWSSCWLLWVLSCFGAWSHFDQPRKIPFSMNLRAQIVVQTPLTVIETKPWVNLCINKSSVSAFVSYWGMKAENQRHQCKERDSVCWNNLVIFEVQAIQTFSRQALGSVFTETFNNT